MPDLAALITKYGLIAVFLGAAVEGDAAVMTGGVLQHRGLLAFWPLVAAAAGGGWLSDLVIFALARRHGAHPRMARLVARAQAVRLVRTLVRYPVVLALVFRFIPGSRTLGPATLALLTPITPAAYAVLTALSSVGWALALVALGHGASRLIALAVGELALHHHLVLWLLAVAATLAARALWHRRRKT